MIQPSSPPHLPAIRGCYPARLPHILRRCSAVSCLCVFSQASPGLDSTAPPHAQAPLSFKPVSSVTSSGCLLGPHQSGRGTRPSACSLAPFHPAPCNSCSCHWSVDTLRTQTAFFIFIYIFVKWMGPQKIEPEHHLELQRGRFELTLRKSCNNVNSLTPVLEGPAWRS